MRLGALNHIQMTLGNSLQVSLSFVLESLDSDDWKWIWPVRAPVTSWTRPFLGPRTPL